MHDLRKLIGHHLHAQAGLVTRGQLLAAELRERQVDGLVQGGRLVAVHRGLYRLRGAPRHPHERAWAAVLTSAGLLTGAHLITMLGLEGGSTAGRPAIVLPDGVHTPRNLAAEVIRADVPAGLRRVAAGGLPCVATELAIIHFAREAPLAELRRALDSGRWAGHVALSTLLELARARPLEMGARKVLWVHEAGLLDDESQGERTLDECLGTLGLLFRRQAADVVPGRRFDRYCDAARLALEYDGRVGARDLDRDAVKDLLAAERGVLVVHITSRMLQPGRRDDTIARIASLLRERLAAHRALAA